ncbi:uncharacterized protein LOC110189842 [Drosophila serrata]|uniref:uncharacterized protein LOC110189842 n=1 Tax=Drosophila serrata TaxID=7274 RepID=UPI000A1D1B7A|nr:uncharacterized protein LOC110189842 [Drosophila serrata]
MDPNMMHYLKPAENPHLDVKYFLAVYACMIVMIVCISVGFLLMGKDSIVETRKERLEANPVKQTRLPHQEARRRNNSIV